ncbi:MAG TPA: hypothetical protein VKR55_11010 [Bradyrhizobium sp.]|uniref:hypothetical protein n=1 Tax=Bradyrhizobium sp. TaxID=376 RepID=UPI002C5F2F60|nr:hypothetical protein [Bradyrhizobium sp.]HLZ02666.1 hypothetical protein [Bradyrhizobium sp.]
MRMILALAAVMYSAAALAQSSAPPAADVHKPAAAAKSARPAKTNKTKTAAKGSIAARLEACQDIDDGTKGRLDCYDEVIKPTPKPNAPEAKTVMECKYTKEEDERLACYNGFVDMMPKLPKS